MLMKLHQAVVGRKAKYIEVMVADNPFGKASSPYILELIFQVAKSNKIRFICFTDHKQKGIVERFTEVTASGSQYFWKRN